MFWASQEKYVLCFGHPVAVNEMQKGIVHILDVILLSVVRGVVDGVFCSLHVVLVNPQ